MALTSSSKVAQTFSPVKATGPPCLSTSPGSVIHHKPYQVLPDKIIVSYKSIERAPYGVSRSYRVLSPQLLLRKFDLVRDCLGCPWG